MIRVNSLHLFFHHPLSSIMVVIRGFRERKMGKIVTDSLTNRFDTVMKTTGYDNTTWYTKRKIKST